jgi:hypothetical protein
MPGPLLLQVSAEGNIRRVDRQGRDVHRHVSQAWGGDSAGQSIKPAPAAVDWFQP